MSKIASLSERFREQVSQLKDYRMKSESEFDVGYSTGFLNFDFKLGVKVFVNDRMTNEAYSYYSLGITEGSINMVIGRSGCGKTTWVLQAAANIIRQFPTSCIFEDNIEGGSTFIRKEVLTKFRDDVYTKRIISRNKGITSENFFERVRMIYDIKMDNLEDYQYDTGTVDRYGNPIYRPEPTVYILDSLPLLMPEKYTDEDELSGQMSATATARANASIFKRLVPLCKSANIILFVINHINQKVEINRFQATKAQVSYLKPGETLPGGNTPIYLSNTLIRFDDKNKLKADEAFGFDGSLVELTLVKSRANKANQCCTLVFNQETGFDNELSMFVMLKDKKLVKGAGAYLYLDATPDIKFSQKTFKSKLKEYPKLREAFGDLIFKVLSGELDSQYEGIKTMLDDYDIDSNDDTMSDILSRVKEKQLLG